MAKRLKGSIVIGAILAELMQTLAAILPTRERIKALAYATEKLAPVATLPTPAGPLLFSCKTRAAARMPLSFFHLGSDTREWLDATLKPGDVLWDVGANIGLFALYAAKATGAQVLAFEASATTFGLLNDNIALNGLGEQIAAYCLALSHETRLGQFHLTDPTAGSASHAYGEAVNTHGPFEARSVQAVMAFRGDDFVKRFQAPKPDHLKIDVDGGEPKVLAGLKGILATTRSVMLRCDADGEQARAVDRLLLAAGLQENQTVRAKGNGNRLYLRPEPTGG